MQSLQKARLYGICDLGYLSLEIAVSVSRELLLGGVDILQLRAKGHQLDSLIPLARELKSLSEDFAVPFIVNDNLSLALESDANGLHLGQDDGSLAVARKALGKGKLLGRSTHSIDQARKALAEGADYIGFGPLYPTPTKEGRPSIGLEEVSRMEAEIGSKIPAFCIGGIKPDNLDEVIKAGARRLVIVSHLLTSNQPREATSQIIKQLL